MINRKIVSLIAMLALGASLCSAAGDSDKGKKAAAQPAHPSGTLFSTNRPAGQPKSSPFSAEISADFIKKVMETSARIEKCKKAIAERQAYLYKSNPQMKAYRDQMIEMQSRINKIMEADQELAAMRLNRDILWTIMPVLPKFRGHQRGRGPRMPGSR